MKYGMLNRTETVWFVFDRFRISRILSGYFAFNSALYRFYVCGYDYEFFKSSMLVQAYELRLYIALLCVWL